MFFRRHARNSSILCRKSRNRYSNDSYTWRFRNLGIDRFYNDNLENIYLPDWLGVIDELTVNRLNKENIIARNLTAVGHPWLDFLFSSV